MSFHLHFIDQQFLGGVFKLQIPWPDLLVWLNAVFLLIIAALSRRLPILQLRFIASATVFLSLCIVYAWFLEFDANYFVFTTIGDITLPIWMLYVPSFLIIWLSGRGSLTTQQWSGLAIYLIVLAYAFSRAKDMLLQMSADPSSLAISALLHFSILISVIQVSVLAPSVVVWNNLVPLAVIKSRRNLATIAVGLLVLFLMSTVESLIVQGKLFHWQVPPINLQVFNSFAFIVVFQILVTHFVSFALSKYTLDRFFPQDSDTVFEIALFAILFAAFHYDFGVWDIVFRFLNAMVFGYWYLKFRTLSVGIVCNLALYLFH